MAKTHTSTEVKQRWIDNNYKRYIASLRYDTDRELIDYIEERKHNGDMTSEIIKEAIEALMEKDK